MKLEPNKDLVAITYIYTSLVPIEVSLLEQEYKLRCYITKLTGDDNFPGYDYFDHTLEELPLLEKIDCVIRNIIQLNDSIDSLLSRLNDLI